MIGRRSCSRCGGAVAPSRQDATFCGSDACKQRAYRTREREAFDPDLAERGDLAWDAIRAGADPELTLSMVLWPPATADDARALLAAAARTGGFGVDFETDRDDDVEESE